MYGLYSAFRFEIPSGEMVEWSITAVLKTAVPRGTGGSNPSLSANSRSSTSYGYFFIIIGTRSIVLIPYFEIQEAYYEVLLANKLATLVAKTVFPQTWSWEQKKITSCSFFSFLIYTFVGVHFNGQKESMLFASACRGDVETLPNNKYH